MQISCRSLVQDVGRYSGKLVQKEDSHSHNTHFITIQASVLCLFYCKGISVSGFPKLVNPKAKASKMTMTITIPIDLQNTIWAY